MKHFKKLAMVMVVAVLLLLPTQKVLAKDQSQHEQGHEYTQRSATSGSKLNSKKEPKAEMHALIVEYKTIKTVSKDLSNSMNLGEPCGLSEEDFVKLMKNIPHDYEGYYKRNARTIWEMEQKYRINAIFYCAIVAIESGWGRADGRGNNYTGMGGGRIRYKSEKANIEATMCNLRKNYILKGRKDLKSIARLYAGKHNTIWPKWIFSTMKQIVQNVPSSKKTTK